jgi:organic hydroperoxide reductase OsmC/OhrA
LAGRVRPDILKFFRGGAYLVAGGVRPEILKFAGKENVDISGQRIRPTQKEVTMSNQPPYYYATEVDWINGRSCALGAPGMPDIEITPPPEFHGTQGIWTPEHLFVASVSCCYVTTFLAIAELSNLEFSAISCGATGKLEKVGGSGFEVTEITLRPNLVLRHTRDLERAGRILEKAERNCLISKSIRSAVRLQPQIDSIEAAADIEVPVEAA